MLKRVLYRIRLKANSREVFSVLNTKIGFENSGLMIELRVLIGLGRSRRLVDFTLLQYHLLTPSWRRVMTQNRKTSRVLNSRVLEFERSRYAYIYIYIIS